MVNGPVAAAILAALVLSFAKPARGQITSYVDEHGKRVYINDDRAEPEGGFHPSRHSQRGRLRDSKRSAVPSVAFGRENPSREQLEMIVADTSARYQLDPNLVRTIISTESDWNPSAISNKGALGLMQLVPATAARFGVADVFDPAANVEGGVRYLSELLTRYQGDLTKSLVGYYAGEGAVERAQGLPRDAATRTYVQKITSAYCSQGCRGGFSEGRDNSNWPTTHIIYETVDERGRVVFTNE